MKAPRGAWLAVGLLWVVALLNYLDRQVLFSTFPLLRDDLRLSDGQLGLLSAAFLWVYAVASPLAGYLGDRLGRRRMVLFSLVVWSAITALTGMARTFPQLMAARGLMGLSEACYLPAALALIASRHTEATRSRAVSLHQSGIYFGIVLGGAGGGWMGAAYGWRPVFYLLGAVGVAYGLLLWRALPADREGAAERVPGLWRNAGAVLRAAGFVRVLLVFAATSLCNWLVYTWLTLYLTERFRINLGTAGFAATFFVQGASVAGILLGGWAADRLARRYRRARVWTQAAGLLVAAPFLILAGVATSPTPLYAALAVFGLGRGIYDSNTMPVLCRLIPGGQRATGYGLLNLMGTLVGGVAAYGTGLVKHTIGVAGALEVAGAVLLLSAFLLLTVPQPDAVEGGNMQ